MIDVAIAYGETELRSRIKTGGGTWRPRQRLWEIDLKTVRALGIEDRVVDPGRG